MGKLSITEGTLYRRAPLHGRHAGLEPVSVLYSTIRPFF